MTTAVVGNLIITIIIVIIITIMIIIGVTSITIPLRVFRASYRIPLHILP